MQYNGPVRTVQFVAICKLNLSLIRSILTDSFFHGESLIHFEKNLSTWDFCAICSTNTQQVCPERYGLPMQKCSDPKCGGDVYYKGICDNILVSGADGPGCPKGGCGKCEPETQQSDQV